MTDEEKVTNGRNSQGSHQLRNNDLAATHLNLTEINDSIVKTAEEKLEDVIGNLIHSPAIEPSILQADVVTGDETTSTTVAPTVPADPPAEAPVEGAAAESTPATELDQAPADQAIDAESQETTTIVPKLEPEENVEFAEESAVKSELPEGQEQEQEQSLEEATTPTSETQETTTDEKSGDTKPTSVGDVTATTDLTTPKTPSKDPYQIDIPIQRKINRRTQRKLWEEIEKRKPLIPKYVERHIQKYAKPPFELWGCRFRGKGSCYGCGG